MGHKMAEILKPDICIIGAGAAGLSVAAGAAQLGLKTVLIEKGKMGGDCLNTGCVPSKAILAAANAANDIKRADSFGVHTTTPVINFRKVKAHIDTVIQSIAPHDSVDRFESLGVTVIQNTAKFTDRNTVQAGEQIIKARYYVIATGSYPIMPEIEGFEPARVYTNETIFDLQQRPDHLVIIGGGPIGVEMAQAHRRLGAKVSLIDRGEILPRDDHECRQVLRDRLLKDGVQLYEHSSLNKISHSDQDSELALDCKGEAHILRASHILVAAGRAPHIKSLGLDEAGVSYDSKGIKTDARLRTSQKKIYAAGDITGAAQFTHIAGYHAGIIIRNLAFKLRAKVDYQSLPWVTYTDPELAQIGMTEAQAREIYGHKVRIARASFSENDRARADKNTDGFIKVVTKKNGRVLGVSMVGAHAGDTIQLWGLVIAQKLKISAVAGLIAPYPTYGEINKRAAGDFYTESLFSDRTRKFVSLLQKIPFIG